MTGEIIVTKQPTYTAFQVRQMCQSMTMDYEGFKVLQELIDEEIDLYTEEDLIILMQASMIAFTRAMFKISAKNLK